MTVAWPKQRTRNEIGKSTVCVIGCIVKKQGRMMVTVI